MGIEEEERWIKEEREVEGDLLLGDMGQVYLYYSPYLCLISIIAIAIVVPAQCYRVLN